MPKKSVTVHYRRLDDIGDRFNGSNLEETCRQAFNQTVGGTRIAERIRHRIWTRDAAGNDNLFVNLFHDSGAALFGDITHYTKGHLQALFRAGLLDNPMIPVQQQPAPEDMEYIHSIMYWMVIENHILLVQSQSLKADVLERYITWLLSEKAGVVPKPLQVILASKFDASAVGGDLNDITGITIGGVVNPRVPEQASRPVPIPAATSTVTQHGEVTARRTTAWQQAREVLAALLGGHAQADEYLETVPEEVELSLELHIGYKTRKKNVDRTPLKALETGLRNLGDGDIQVTARGGKKGPDGDIRLHETVQIEQIFSLLDPNDVREKMLAVYRSFVETGKIAP